MANSNKFNLSCVNDNPGYRQPPKHTRWQRGQSGNPKGRERGSRNFKTEVKELLNSMVNIVRDGKPKKISAQRAALERLFDKALNGDIRALTQLIRLAQEHSDAGPSNAERLSANDEQILEIYKARILSGARREWIHWYTAAPTRNPEMRVVQSWDIASTTGATNDCSVCTTWLIDRRAYYLLDVWRGRLAFPHLKRRVIELARDHAPNCILIEEAGPGLHLVQEFRVNPEPGIPVPIGIKPQESKIVRMEAHSARFEAGQVYLPEQAPWLAEYLHEVLAFPNARFDDQVDSTSQFLNWAEVSARRFSDEPDYSWLSWWSEINSRNR
jgi:predicted phage terminase large subunit-like protein